MTRGSARRLGALLAAAIFPVAIPQVCPAQALPAEPIPYTVKLSSWVPKPGRVGGLLLKARINGGAPMRFLLDSGAERLVLGKAAAAKSGLSTTSDFLLVGLGESNARTVRTGKIESVEIGPLTFRNCPVDVVPGRIAEGLDGIVPMSIFKGSLLRLDLSGKTLALLPYPGERIHQWEASEHAVLANGLLFVRAVLNEQHEGVFLLDTGATFNAISNKTAAFLRSIRDEPVDLETGGHSVNAEKIASDVKLEFGGQKLHSDPVVAVDMRTFGSYNGFEIAGLLGYPALANTVVTVNYRDLLVRIEPAKQ
jgi:predicted aspartyl protease